MDSGRNRIKSINFSLIFSLESSSFVLLSNTFVIVMYSSELLAITLITPSICVANCLINKCASYFVIESEKCWGYHYDNKSDAGKKITYRCNLVKARGQQCDAAVHLLFDAKNTSIHLYRADSIHTHDDEISRNNVVSTISGALEAEIRNMFELGMKTKAILYNLTKKGLTAPTKSKLTFFLTKLRNEKFGASKLHFGSLEQWLKECNEVPESVNQPFFVAYDVKINEASPDDSTFHFLVSTKTLL